MANAGEVSATDSIIVLLQRERFAAADLTRVSEALRDARSSSALQAKAALTEVLGETRATRRDAVKRCAHELLRASAVADRMNASKHMNASERFTASDVAAALAARRYSFVSERSLQSAVGTVLENAFPGAFRAEVALGDAGRIDFLAVHDGVGVEAKAYRTGGSPSAVLKQLAGYASHPAIRGLVLVAGSPALVAALPRLALGGKPIIGVIARGSFV